MGHSSRMISPAYLFVIRESDMAEKLLEKFTLHNELSETTRLGELLASFTERHNIAARLAFRIDLVLDELVTNIIKYGDMEKGSQQEINIELYDAGPDKLKIVVIDSGVAFDPLQAEAPDDRRASFIACSNVVDSSLIVASAAVTGVLIAAGIPTAETGKGISKRARRCPSVATARKTCWPSSPAAWR